MAEHDDLAERVREWYAGKPDAQRAAAELVIWKGLSCRQDFADECVLRSDLGVSIDWPSARRFLSLPRVISGSEWTVLAIAVAIAEGELLPSGVAELGDAHRRAVADAVCRSLGIEPGAPPPAPKLTVAEAFDVAEARRVVGHSNPGLLSASVSHLLDVIARIAPQDDGSA